MIWEKGITPYAERKTVCWAERTPVSMTRARLERMDDDVTVAVLCIIKDLRKESDSLCESRGCGKLVWLNMEK
jgi:hypothetical protein